MSITLDLPQELVSKLSAEAARLGVSLSEYVVHVLSTGRLAEQRLKTGEEVVAYWQGEGVMGSLDWRMMNAMIGCRVVLSQAQGQPGNA